MKMVKKILVLILSLIFISSLGAVSLSTDILSLSSSANLFSNQGRGGYFNGFFPMEVKLRFKTVLPQEIKDLGLGITTNVSSGIKNRLLGFNPDTGEVLNGSVESLSYQLHYIYFDLDFSAALISEPYMSEDILSLHFALHGDYENAYEKLGWYTHPDEGGVFFDEDGKHRYNEFTYAPELKGNRMLSYTGFSLSAVFNWKEETEMTKDGFWASLRAKYMPSWMPFHDKSESNFFSLYANAGFALTLMEVSQMSFGPSEGLDAFSVIFQTEFDSAFAFGKNIPLYSVERKVWGIDSASDHMVIANTTSLTIKLFQFRKDLYPTLTLLSDMSLSFGGGINGRESGVNFIGAIGAKLDMNIYSMFSIYGEVGYVYKDLDNRNPGLRYAFGAKVRI